MRTAVDSSVLLAIAKGEAAAPQWIEVLAEAGMAGELVICDVVAAEYFALVLEEQAFRRTLALLGIKFLETTLESSEMAGRLFRAYRNEGGPRTHLIPDFLVGAHALCQADQLAAVDRGFLRRYFPRLTILAA